MAVIVMVAVTQSDDSSTVRGSQYGDAFAEVSTCSEQAQVLADVVEDIDQRTSGMDPGSGQVREIRGELLDGMNAGNSAAPAFFDAGVCVGEAWDVDLCAELRLVKQGAVRDQLANDSLCSFSDMRIDFCISMLQFPDVTPMIEDYGYGMASTTPMLSAHDADVIQRGFDSLIAPLRGTIQEPLADGLEFLREVTLGNLASQVDPNRAEAIGEQFSALGKGLCRSRERGGYPQSTATSEANADLSSWLGSSGGELNDMYAMLIRAIYSDRESVPCGDIERALEMMDRGVVLRALKTHSNEPSIDTYDAWIDSIEASMPICWAAAETPRSQDDVNRWLDVTGEIEHVFGRHLVALDWFEGYWSARVSKSAEELGL